VNSLDFIIIGIDSLKNLRRIASGIQLISLVSLSPVECDYKIDNKILAIIRALEE